MVPGLCCCGGEKGKPEERPGEGEQSLAADHTGDCNICMVSLHWEDGGMFIWNKEELGLGAVVLWLWAECCHGAFGGHVFVLLSCAEEADNCRQGPEGE